MAPRVPKRCCKADGASMTCWVARRKLSPDATFTLSYSDGKSQEAGLATLIARTMALLSLRIVDAIGRQVDDKKTLETASTCHADVFML